MCVFLPSSLVAAFLMSTTSICGLTTPPSVAANEGEDGKIANSALPMTTAAVTADTGGAKVFGRSFWKRNKKIRVKFGKYMNRNMSTVKPVHNDHPRDSKIVAVVDRWSLFGGHLCKKRSNWDLKIMAVVDRWWLFGGGR